MSDFSPISVQTPDLAIKVRDLVVGFGEKLIMKGLNLDAVSYTHLDVYKRQHVAHAPDLAVFFVRMAFRFMRE